MPRASTVAAATGLTLLALVAAAAGTPSTGTAVGADRLSGGGVAGTAIGTASTSPFDATSPLGATSPLDPASSAATLPSDVAATFAVDATAAPGPYGTWTVEVPSGAGYAASPLAADGIPATALAAYQHAQNLVATSDPGCRVPWELLAAIGRVESDHGRFAGAVLRTDGTSSRPVIGIPLDGNGTERIGDTDGGRLDGDPFLDRAVGPMQFIPSTWAGYRADGNADGATDPFNIYDAALAAAHYLCSAGGDLSTLAGQTRAVLAYNHSSEYLATVLGLERTYATGGSADVPVIPDPAGLPATGPTDRPGRPTPPPVDPGPPLGTGRPDPTRAPSSSSSSPNIPSSTATSPRPARSSATPTSPSPSPSPLPSTSSAHGGPPSVVGVPTGSSTAASCPAPTVSTSASPTGPDASSSAPGTASTGNVTASPAAATDTAVSIDGATTAATALDAATPNDTATATDSGSGGASATEGATSSGSAPPTCP